MKLVYLPLDSRPCNAQFPAQLLACAGVACVTPPPGSMDYFTRPAAHSRAASFLARETADADTLLLSVDQLVFGSLLASREPDVPIGEALCRAEWIATLKDANPRLRIVAFSVIMRSSISTLRAEDIAYHHAVTAYSQASHHAQCGGTPEDLAEVRRIAETIPSWILDKYHRVRERNHQVNLACLSLVQQNVIDSLLLLQEDAQPLGFHKLEQKALLSAAEKGGVKDRVALHNGTDEAGCLCAAAVAAKPLKLHVLELGGGDLNFIAKYEDRPFAENIASHCRFAGIHLTTPEDADKLLCVLTPGKDRQQDVLYASNSRCQRETPEMKRRNARLARELAGHLAGGKPVGLLDVLYANGGSASFMESLAEQADPLDLRAYAAWNTASNSLGTVLAQLALGEKDEPNARFTAERLLDDLLYQGVVRGRLQAELQALGEDPLALADKDRAERMLGRLMEEAARESGFFRGYDVRAAYRLPWPRTFEAEVSVQRLRRGGHSNTASH